MTVSRKILCLGFVFVSFLSVSMAAEAPPFAPWRGVWKGELTTYSVVGDLLQKQQVQFSSSAQPGHAEEIQTITIEARSDHGDFEKQNGLYLQVKGGLRRILKTDKGQLVSDLRGRVIGPSKIYWYSIDSKAILRESYIETVEGDAMSIQGFRWDGQRSGSYRIVEGSYRRQ